MKSVNIIVTHIKEAEIMFNEYGDLLTAEETCEALRIGHNLIYELLNSGKLRGFRCGRVWKVPRLALEQYVCEQAKIAK